jgi:tetratricopeptide (TPR) repeat protein/O-antigen ligase
MHRILLFILLIFMPLAHGAVELWSVTVFHTASIIMIGWWALSSAYAGDVRFYRTPVDIPVMILISLAFLSVFISVYPYASRIELYKVINYAAIFYYVINVMKSDKGVFGLTWGIALIGGVFAVAGLVFTEGSFLGFRVFSPGIYYTSFTFVNHNHYAGYMEMITMICVGLAVANKGLKRILSLSLGVIAALAVIFSLSRGGLLGLAGGFLFFFLFFALCRGRRRVFVLGLGLIILVLTGLFVHGDLGPVLDRFETLEMPLETGVGRLLLWNDTLKMAADNPWFGSGLGTFMYVYPRYQSFASGAGGYIIKHAHNDYLELIAETGVAGFLPVLLAVICLFVFSLRKFVILQDMKFKATGLGALSGCFALLIHGITDFNFAIPSNALLFTVCAALAAACACSDMGEHVSTWLNISLTGGKRRALMYSAISVLSVVSLMIVVSPYLGSVYLQKAGDYQNDEDYERADSAVRKALFADPGNAELSALIGDMYVKRSYGDQTGKDREADLITSLKYYNAAIKECPVRSHYYFRKAYVLQSLSRYREAEETLRKSVYFEPMNHGARDLYAQYFLSNGELGRAVDEYKVSMQILENGKHLIKILNEMWELTRSYDDLKQVVPDSAGMRSIFVKFLAEKGKTHEAVAELAYAFTLEPTAFRAAEHLLGLHIYEKDYRRAMKAGEEYLMKFGDHQRLLSEMGRIYRKTGNRDRAIAVYERLLSMKVSYTQYVHPLAILYMEAERYSDAISIIETGLEFQPDNGKLYYFLGNINRALNNNEKAIEALKKAVALEPYNTGYRFHLVLAYKYNALYSEAYDEAKKCLEINPEHEPCDREMKSLSQSR